MSCVWIKGSAGKFWRCSTPGTWELYPEMPLCPQIAAYKAFLAFDREVDIVRKMHGWFKLASPLIHQAGLRLHYEQFSNKAT